mmetsp:Transcript_83841/g.132031  ORF Transcript_83841/g.132031 Transcript_83841/m.132031 type:complete len:529 (+) Transcript_83841:89-1675(+)
MADMQEAMSKSAKRRAAKKARDAAAEEEPAPAPKATPAEAPKSAPKAKAKAQTAPAVAAAPKAAEPKSKAKAKAEPKVEPVPEPKAKAKGKAEPKASVEQPKAKEQPKAASKAKAKAKAEAPPPPKKEEEIPEYIQFDDGKGGAWEECTGKSKKQEKQAEKKKQKEEEEAKKKLEEEEAAKKAEIEAKKQAKQAQKQAAKAATEPKVETPKPVAPVAPAPAKVVPATATTKAEPEGPKEPPDTTVVVKIPEGKIGRVIGPKGANIIKIQEKTEIKKIDTMGDTVTIIGPAEKVPLAEAAVKELIEKGYMQLAFDNFAQDGVMIHPSSIPDIIGSRGAVINAIKDHTKVEIKMPEVPKGGKDGLGKGGSGAESKQKYKVEIVGDKEGVDQAKEIINSILMYGHHEVTHPDEAHEEMEIPQESYGFIIGRGGSELRHIQNSYHVKVNIPRATSVNDKVVIVGLSSDVERAVKHINKLMMDESEKAQEREQKEAAKAAGKGSTERAPRRSDDDDEGPMEPWMRAYIRDPKR